MTLKLAPLRFPHDNHRGLVLTVGRFRAGMHLWLKFWTWPTLTYYRVSDEGGHNLRVGPILVAWCGGRETVTHIRTTYIDTKCRNDF